MREYILEIRKLISQEHCKKIISIFDKNLETARTVGGENRSIRNCDLTSILHPISFGEKICSNFIQSKMFECVDLYKQKFPYLEVEKLSAINFLRYDHNEYKAGYLFHCDFGTKVPLRHISISICLNNDFEGGEFVFDIPGGEMTVPQNVGDAIVFPSNFMFPHQVNKIINGPRYALVGWVI